MKVKAQTVAREPVGKGGRDEKDDLSPTTGATIATFVALTPLAAVARVPAPTLAGTVANDRIFGTPNDDSIWGFAGKHQIYPRGGDDYVFGGGSPDTIRDVYGWRDKDHIIPGSGHDRVHAGGGPDFIEADDGTRDDIECGDGVDRAYLDVRPHEVADDWGNCDFINDKRVKNIYFSITRRDPTPRLRKTGNFRETFLRKEGAYRLCLS